MPNTLQRKRTETNKNVNEINQTKWCGTQMMPLKLSNSKDRRNTYDE